MCVYCRGVSRKNNVRMKIVDKIDSRLEAKFIFYKYWQFQSEVLITNLSIEAKQYNKN